MPDFAAEGLLDGLEGAPRAARERLLQRLHDDGVELDELRAAIAEDALYLLPAERLVGGTTRYTPDEVAERSGLDLDTLRQMRRAHGLPTPADGSPTFNEGDVDAARTAKTFLDAGVDLEDMLTIVRILGRGLGQAANAMRTATLKLVITPGQPPGDEDELALAYADAIAALEPMSGPMLGQMLNLHLRNIVRSELADLQAGRLAGAREVAVLFADLVGFTRVGEEVQPEELGAIAGRLEALASDLAEPPVRLIKTIGDAVMLVSPQVDALLETAIELVAAVEAERETMPQLRVGVAFGPALPRAGDWFGAPVNLASRVTGIARPASVLVTDEVKALADGERFAFSFAGARSIKGVHGDTPVHRVRRADDEEATDHDGESRRDRRRRRRS